MERHERTRSQGATLEALHPVLMAKDVHASVRFFERLGFRRTFIDDPSNPRYAAVTRDGIELHLQWHDEAQWGHPVDLPTYRFIVSDVDRFYGELQADPELAELLASSGSPWATPADTPWGTREFHVRDPAGNGIHLYRPLGE